MVKRDIFTGKLLDGITEEEVFLKKVTKFISKNQENLRELSVSKQLKSTPKPIEFKPSPAPAEVVNKTMSLLSPQDANKQKPSPGKSFLDCKSGQEMFSKSIEIEETKSNNNLGDPADKNIPKILKPDSLRKNEQFYENLRSGLKNFAAQNQDESSKYSHHLGRAEFGTLTKKQTTNSIISKVSNVENNIDQSR